MYVHDAAERFHTFTEATFVPFLFNNLGKNILL